ncbi:MULTISPECIES: hypothetical protein [Lysinibacillus]|uniref:hypothetical protein n=1 Tax=Lysinibacillus TaxID=400634 RepID=UPI000560E79B|nr:MULTISPECIES: hypothetical protein [Lysinibacillus]KUF29640.1 hypothetical protein AK833_18720 [Lysinibacillus sp. F5]MEE3809179.1 hypothetical protein [Lysinibacillus fusiformis]
MSKFKHVLMVSALSLGFLGAMNGEALAKDPQTFTNFTVTYSGAEKFAPYSVRHSDTDAIVNLANDSGTAWITATMKNSNDVYRGGTTLQRGERKTFAAVNAAVNHQYKLGLRKTNDTGGGSVTISGSWAASN